MSGIPAHPDSVFPRYGDVDLSASAEKGIVGTLIILVFLLMAVEVVDPDVAFFGALVVCLITGILNMVSTRLNTSSFFMSCRQAASHSASPSSAGIFSSDLFRHLTNAPQSLPKT
jgi:hypothetical protein